MEAIVDYLHQTACNLQLRTPRGFIFNEMIKKKGVKVRYGAQVARAKFNSTKVSALPSWPRNIKSFYDASYEGDLMAAAMYRMSLEIITTSPWLDCQHSIEN